MARFNTKPVSTMPTIQPHCRHPHAMLHSSSGTTHTTAMPECARVFEAQSLSVEQYMEHLCCMIAREGHNLALRRNYEQMLSQLRTVRELSQQHV
jgi:hypothetical protein